MLGDISYDKATLKSEGKLSIHSHSLTPSFFHYGLLLYLWCSSILSGFFQSKGNFVRDQPNSKYNKLRLSLNPAKSLAIVISLSIALVAILRFFPCTAKILIK